MYRPIHAEQQISISVHRARGPIHSLLIGSMDTMYIINNTISIMVLCTRCNTSDLRHGFLVRFVAVSCKLDTPVLSELGHLPHRLRSKDIQLLVRVLGVCIPPHHGHHLASRKKSARRSTAYRAFIYLFRYLLNFIGSIIY